MVTENGVEEETAVKGGSGVGSGHVGVIEVLDVVVEVNADAGRRRKGSMHAAMARCSEILRKQRFIIIF